MSSRGADGFECRRGSELPRSRRFDFPRCSAPNQGKQNRRSSDQGQRCHDDSGFVCFQHSRPVITGSSANPLFCVQYARQTSPLISESYAGSPGIGRGSGVSPFMEAPARHDFTCIRQGPSSASTLSPSSRHGHSPSRTSAHQDRKSCPGPATPTADRATSPNAKVRSWYRGDRRVSSGAADVRRSSAHAPTRRAESSRRTRIPPTTSSTVTPPRTSRPTGRAPMSTTSLRRRSIPT
jgi:hypothetical protein